MYYSFRELLICKVTFAMHRNNTDFFISRKFELYTWINKTFYFNIYLIPLLVGLCLQNLKVILASWHTYLPTPFCPTLINLVAGNDFEDILHLSGLSCTLIFRKYKHWISLRSHCLMKRNWIYIWNIDI